MSGLRPHGPSPVDPGQLLQRLTGLAWTHYLELVRQPVFGVVLAFGLVVVALSPALAVFSIGRAEALVLDLGASALLFFSVFLAAVAVAGGAAERLEDGTTTLLLTHPAGPATVLTGQLLGGAMALGQACFLQGIVLLWAIRHGPDRLHQGVLVPAGVAVGLSLAWGIRASLSRRAFQPAAIGAATVLLPVAFLISRGLGPDLQVYGSLYPVDQVGLAAATLAGLASLPFAALGQALASRLGMAPTATLTLLAFVLGSLVQGPLAPPAIEVWTDAFDPRHLTFLLPDLQLYWVSDAAYTETEVPSAYVASVAIYSLLYTGALLAVGSFLLSGRELGRGSA